VANSRFLLTNLVETATLKNGTGGGAPARDETTPYIMENAKDSDRYHVWTSATTPASPLNVEFDMGSAVSIEAGALLGARSQDATQTLQLAVYSATAYPGGPWTLRGITSASTKRDMATTFNAVSARYWRMQITPSVPSKFSIGRLWLGAIMDLALKHSPGAKSSPFRNRIEQAQATGPLVLNDLGDPGRDISLPFGQVGSATDTLLLTLHDQVGSFVFIDPDSNVFEVILRGGRVDRANNFSTYSDSIDMARLP